MTSEQTTADVWDDMVLTPAATPRHPLNVQQQAGELLAFSKMPARMSASTAPGSDPLAGIPERTPHPRGDAATAFFHVPMCVRPDECQALLDLFQAYDEAGNTRHLAHSTRLDSVYLGGHPAWEQAHPNVVVPAGTDRITRRLSALIQGHNMEHWRFDIAAFPFMCIPPEVTLDWQEAGGAGHFWHSDYSRRIADKDRDHDPKIVAIVQLSDPADYEGGAFEIFASEQIVRPVLEQGDMVLFPAFLLHRRQPITRGGRFILMVQAWGPAWR
jgi:PKHD-type hydroxylase